jgi:hypothetical protein
MLVGVERMERRMTAIAAPRVKTVAVAVARRPVQDHWPLHLRLALIVGTSAALWSGIIGAIVALH